MRYRLNDYSVPTTYGHRDVLVRGYVHEVVISCGGEVIARHPRSYAREDFVFEPLHYLALIEQKINAFDQAAPPVGWRLPEEFTSARRSTRTAWSSRIPRAISSRSAVWLAGRASFSPTACRGSDVLKGGSCIRAVLFPYGNSEVIKPFRPRKRHGKRIANSNANSVRPRQRSEKSLQ